MKNDAELIMELLGKVKTLEEKNDVLESFIENSNDAIQISDKNLVTIRVNRAYETLTGIRREELVGLPVADLIKMHLINESCGAIVQKTKKPHTIIQKFYRTGRSAHVSCTPFFDDNGEILYYFCNDRDLEEISNLQLKLHEESSLKEKYKNELSTVKQQLISYQNFIVEDENMLQVINLANRIAKVDSHVLLLGETGSGKDEIAKYIHRVSNRKNQDFVPVNCSALTEALFESEFFGYEGNSFTGASSKGKQGLFEVANKGTLFLDEIGELSLNMQAKLLRVIQSGSFLRVGGSKEIKVDVRIIAATNRDLAKMVREGTFREDLYYRLSVFPISIPPLRERKHDIMPLALSFLDSYNKKYGLKKVLNSASRFALMNYHWPGNVRELKNVVEYAIIVTDDDTIQPENLKFEKVNQQSISPLNITGESLSEILEKTELFYLESAYSMHGNIRDAAEQLKMSPATFLRHIRELRKKHSNVEE